MEFASTVKVIYENQCLESDLMDISLRGALIQSDQAQRIDKGVSCILEFDLGVAEIELKINSKVLYKQDNRLGLEFENIDIESMTHLRRLVELNIGNSDQVQQELFFLVRSETR